MADEIDFTPIAVAPPDQRVAYALEIIAEAEIAQHKVLQEIKEALVLVAKKVG